MVSARAADMTKTLHVAFTNAETGFDPQGAAIRRLHLPSRRIFDPLYGPIISRARCG